MNNLRFFILLNTILLTFFVILNIFFKKKRCRLKPTVKLLFLIIFIANFIFPFILNNNKIEEKPKVDNKVEDKEETKEPEKKEPIIEEKTNLTSKGFKIEEIDGATYIDGQLIANKTYLLPSTFVPKNTHKETTSETEFCQTCIVNEAYDAFSKMKNDASKLGLNLWIQSGYRSYSYQVILYNKYVKNQGKEAADTFSARPGASEHQTGLSFDLNTITHAFANTKEGKWVDSNCYKYGFIIRFPKGKEKETGYEYESWHLRYVGYELAKKLYNNGDWISMEDYFGITSEYQNE